MIAPIYKGIQKIFENSITRLPYLKCHKSCFSSERSLSFKTRFSFSSLIFAKIKIIGLVTIQKTYCCFRASQKKDYGVGKLKEKLEYLPWIYRRINFWITSWYFFCCWFWKIRFLKKKLREMTIYRKRINGLIYSEGPLIGPIQRPRITPNRVGFSPIS